MKLHTRTCTRRCLLTVHRNACHNACPPLPVAVVHLLHAEMRACAVCLPSAGMHTRAVRSPRAGMHAHHCLSDARQDTCLLLFICCVLECPLAAAAAAVHLLHAETYTRTICLPSAGMRIHAVHLPHTGMRTCCHLFTAQRNARRCCPPLLFIRRVQGRTPAVRLLRTGMRACHSFARGRGHKAPNNRHLAVAVSRCGQEQAHRQGCAQRHCKCGGNGHGRAWVLWHGGGHNKHALVEQAQVLAQCAQGRGGEQAPTCVGRRRCGLCTSAKQAGQGVLMTIIAGKNKSVVTSKKV